MYKVSELQGYLPHHGPMEWIDRVLHFSAGSGTCAIDIDPSSLYCVEGRFKQSSFLELIAQSFGFVIASNIKKRTGQVIPIKSAYFVGMTKVVFGESLPLLGEEVLIDVLEERRVGLISFVRGRVYSPLTKEIFCEATLKLYSEESL